jgi:hypothetical protein
MDFRMAGIRAAKADVLVFLDSHIEAGVGWLEPLLFRIQDDPKVRIAIKVYLHKARKNFVALCCKLILTVILVSRDIVQQGAT